MRRYIAYFVFLFGIAGLLAGGPSVRAGADYEFDKITYLYAHDEYKLIEKGVSYLFESTPMSHIQAARLDDYRWTENKRKIANLGPRSHPVWLRFDLCNMAEPSTEWLLETNWGHLDRIELFLYHHGSGQWDGPMLSGKLVPLSQRVTDHYLYVFPVKLAPKDRTTVYLRVVSNSKLIIPLKIWQKEAFRISMTDQLMLTGLFFGILAVMAAYNFFLYIPTRDKSFLYFSVFVVSLILYALIPTGIGTRYFLNEAVWLKTHSYGLFSSLSFLAAVLFFRHYLRLKQYGGWVLKLNTIFIAYWIFSTMVFLFRSPPFFLLLEDMAGLLSTIAGMVTAVYCLNKKDPSARLFSVAWGVLAIGTVLLILSLLGILEQNWITTYSQPVSFLLVVILLSFGLAERINRERITRVAAQQEALALSRKVAAERAANLAAQQRMLKLQRQINEELESKVKERTAELEQAMQRLAGTNQELAQLNITDALTKVYNRRYFDRVLAEEIQRARRNGLPLSVIIADIDHFKAINDTYGHLIGDECLRLVARTIQEQISEHSNLVARYGGEEFALILPAISSENALLLAEQIRIALEKLEFTARGSIVDLRISLGVAGWVPRPDETPEKLVRTADKALYHAKQRGRNRSAIAEVD